MAGLLDILGSDTGLLGLQLMAAGSAKPVRTGFGEGLLSSLQAVQAQRAAEEDRKARQQMQAMQMQQMQEAATARKQAQEQQQQRMSYLGAIDSDQGPAMPLSVPRALSAGLSLPEIGALMPQQTKGPEFKVVGGRLVRIQGDDVREAYAAPDKPNLNDLIIPGPDGKPMLNKALFDARRQLAQAGATNVGVSYGAPMAGKDAAGNDVFFAPPKDPTKSGPVIIPGVRPANADKATEDQSKAAGWLSQADNAYKNMLAAGFDKEGNPKAAAYPGPLDALEKVPGVGVAANAMRTADRQKFIQASASLSEALLRAATGAGVNMDEARQKVQELTPQFGERQETTRQKMAAIPQYIQSLKVRAGSAAAKMPQAQSNDSDPLGIRGN